MGTALARALSSNGYEIDAMVALHKQRARRAAELAGAPHALILTNKQLAELPKSDILFITTPDDAIESTAAQLAANWKSRAASGNSRRPYARTILHASGALSSEVLQTLSDVGFATGSMHPLLSVNDAAHGADGLASAFFCIEGDERAQRVARSLVRALGAKSFSINAGDKALYHAAAVMASGQVTALLDIAIEMLMHCGLKEKRARALLLPLLKSALENLYANNPAHALTGTFARADTSTVRRHLSALNSKKMTDALAAYRLLGLRSLRLAKEAGAGLEALKEIKQLLTTEDTEGRRGEE